MRENYEDYKEEIESFLLDYLPYVDPRSEKIKEAMQYSLSAGGKRLRPVLLLAACEFAGGKSKAALPYACAIEFIHTYSLIHDDLPAMDNDDLRRGKPTNHKVFGDGMAILAGDALLNSAFEIMSKDMMMYFGNSDELSKRINAMYAIAKGAGVQGMIAGQTADILNESNTDVDESILSFIHRNKTAALIVSAVQAGLYIGGADKEMFNAMSRYAEKLGLAFQIADDILDVKGNKEILGKTPGSDEDKKKTTYVSIHGIDESERMLSEMTKQAVDAISNYYDNAEFFKTLVQDLEKRTY